MSDAIFSSADRQEALSRAYIQAVAAQAGYSTSYPDIDRDSVDITISAGGAFRPRLDIQLKATINLARNGKNFRFPVSIKNYDDLRMAAQTPRILAVLDMPQSETEWMEVTAEKLVLRRAAYWVSLRGLADSDNDTSVTISIPTSNIFDVDGLRNLMEQSRNGRVE